MMSKIPMFDIIEITFLVNKNDLKSSHALLYSPKSVQNAKTGNLKNLDHPPFSHCA